MLKRFAEISSDVVAEAGSGDLLAGKIHQSFLGFWKSIGEWSNLAEGAYLPIRGFG